MNAPRPPAATRWLSAVAVTTVPATVVLFTARSWRDRLPDPLPRHWNAAGQVDGVAGLATTVTAMLVITGVAAAVAAGAALAPRLRWRLRRTVIAATAAVSSFVAGVWLVTAELAWDVPQAALVVQPTWHILALLAGAGGWTALAVVACGTAPPRPAAADRPPAGLPRIDLHPGQRAVWSETTSVPPVALLTQVPLLAVAAVLAVVVDPWVAAPVLLTALLVLAVHANRLTVDARGVTIGFGPWGWPRLRVPLHEIASACPTTVRFAEWGGWGYRMNLDGRGRGLITRRGPGVRLDLSADRYLVAGVRDPQAVTGLVNGLLDAARPR